MNNARPLILVATVVLWSGIACTAFAGGAQESQWRDFTKPTTLQARMIIIDRKEKKVWLNLSAISANSEGATWWFPGANIGFYPADDVVWQTLTELGNCCPGPDDTTKIPSAKDAPLLEIVAHQVKGSDMIIIESAKVVTARTMSQVVPFPPKDIDAVVRESSPNTEKITVRQGNQQRSLTIKQVRDKDYHLSYGWTSAEGEPKTKEVVLTDRKLLQSQVAAFLSKEFALK